MLAIDLTDTSRYINIYIVEYRAICGSRRTTLHGMEYASNMRKFYNQFVSIVYCRSMIAGSPDRSGDLKEIYVVVPQNCCSFQGENVSMCQLSFSCLPKTANKFQVCATIAN